MKTIFSICIFLFSANQIFSQIQLPIEINFHEWQEVKQHAMETINVYSIQNEDSLLVLKKYYDKKGNNFKNIAYGRGEECIETNFYQYDNNHNKTIWHSHSCIFGLDMDRYLADTIYYNNENRLIREKKYVRTSFEPEVFHSSFQDGKEYKYSNIDNTLEIKTYDLTYPYGKRKLSSVKFFKYNKNNLIAEYLKINNTNDTIHDLFFEYDTKNRIQKSYGTVRKPNENWIGTPPFRGDFIYNKKGKLNQKINEDGTITYYSYYENGLIKQIKEVDLYKNSNIKYFNYEY
jgi:hypothetical protein